MKRTTRSAAVGLAAALGLTAAVIPGVVSAQEDPGPVPFVSTLTLDTKSTPQLTLEGAPSLNQTLTTSNPSLNNCNLDTTPSLLGFKGYLGEAVAANEKPVGFLNRSVGVNEQISSVCNRVDALSSTNKVETLEIALADGIEVVNNVPVLGARSASLDIEVTSIRRLFSRQKAVVEAKAFDANGLLATKTITQGVDGCGTADGSNCRLDLAMPDDDTYFTKLTLTAKAGAFSLEGGSDTSETPKAAPSTFELVTLVDAVVECPAQEGERIEPIERDGVTLEYLGNADGTCESFGLTLGVEEDGAVSFLKPLGVATDAQFIFDVTWTRENADGLPSFDIPTAKIDFEAPSTQGFQDMAFCPDDVYDENGVLTGLPPGTNPSVLGTDFVPDVQLPGFQFACLDDPRDIQLGATEVVVTDKIYLIGDAKMRF